MSYFIIGIGGTGAKLMHSLIHMTAAGLLPDPGRTLVGLLVDSDQNNGSVHACVQVASLYARCKTLQYGSRTHLFKNGVDLIGPWTPVSDPEVVDLETIFDYTRMRRKTPDDADLMELLFSPRERTMKILEGFRGRPAIGATVFGQTVSNSDKVWKNLGERARNAQAHPSVPLLLAGSVFGGSGAAGVPTICRLLQRDYKKTIEKLRVGLILFLPYFTYAPVEGEVMQANPQEFPSTTSEALKYYHESNFLDVCHEIYTVGETHPAKMPVSSVGKLDQRNPPHFIEMIAGFGAIRFLGGKLDDTHEVLLAGRKDDATLQWSDLPTAIDQHADLTAKLQQMILFAVAYHYIYYPQIESRDGNNTILSHLEKVPGHDAAEDLAAMDAYTESFLYWLLSISTPDREGAPVFSPGLVDASVIAVPLGGSRQWQLKSRKSFKGREKGPQFFDDDDLGKLFRNLETKMRPNLRAISRAATATVDDADAHGAGRLVRAIYDACKLS